MDRQICSNSAPWCLDPSDFTIAFRRLPRLSCFIRTTLRPYTPPTSFRSSFHRKASTMATLGASEKRHKVTVVGSGNWGSAIAKIVAENTKAHPELFEPEVRMVRSIRSMVSIKETTLTWSQWVYEEQVTVPSNSKHYQKGSKYSEEKSNLTELINHYHGM